MNIGFMGLGKLGLPCALAVESKGHNVKGYDISNNVREIVKNRMIPYKEEGAQEFLLKSNIEVVPVGKLVEFSDLIFVAIQTPHDEKYEGVTVLPESRMDFDYYYLKNGIKTLAELALYQRKKISVIIISTVLPGTIEREIKPLLNDYVKLCYNPFFIAMGTTIRDFLYPEFILFGVDDKETVCKAKKFYETITDAPFYETSIKNAELIKVGYNTYIGMKIVFANVLMEICHKIGADVDAVTNGIKMGTRRIISGQYFSGGMGDGGGCHPRDNIALSWLARELNLSYDWFDKLMTAREKQTEWLADLMMSYDLPKVILGKAFKPETNLIVGSPSILLKNILEGKGCKVDMYDPYIDKELPKFKASVFLIGTKHPEFINFNFPAGSVVIDPWRYIPNCKDVKVIRLGENR